MKRRAAIEPMIGHLKADHRMGRYYLSGLDGDCSNAIFAAAGHNVGLLLRWLAESLRASSPRSCRAPRRLYALESALPVVFTDDPAE